MILVNRTSLISVYKKSFDYTYLHWRARARFGMSSWHEPLCNEEGQRPIGPTILVEWEE